MLNVTYLAILEPEADGSYSVFFPNLPGCFSYGKDLEEAQRMATEAASLPVYGLECDNAIGNCSNGLSANSEINQ